MYLCVCATCTDVVVANKHCRLQNLGTNMFVFVRHTLQAVMRDGVCVYMCVCARRMQVEVLIRKGPVCAKKTAVVDDE